jgi:hypothetical protein
MTQAIDILRQLVRDHMEHGVIKEIPAFPPHMDTVDCWCKPVVTENVFGVKIKHKDLAKGEFDA